METQKTYKLGGDRLDEFIVELGKAGFSYERRFGQIRDEEKDVTAGRILDIDPYYLVVNPLHPDSSVQIGVVSRLVILADNF